jgi:pimeloyl-ACP methyl ester carboxylesterase
MIYQDSHKALLIKSIYANDLNFSYLELGQGPLVLLLHGFPDNAYTWEEIMLKLADEGFHAVAVFNRGYYPTDIPDNRDYSVARVADDVLSLITAFGEKNAVLVGQDWGALIAYAAGNKNPNMIKKIVTIAVPHPKFLKPTLSFLGTVSHMLVFQFGLISSWYVRRNNFIYLERLYRYWSPSWFSPEDEFDKIKSDFSRPGRLQAVLSYYRSALIDAFNTTKMKLYKKTTTVPTLVFVGNEDPLYRIGLFSENKKAFSGPFEMIVVPHTGHFLHREQPEIISKKITEFLKKITYSLDFYFKNFFQKLSWRYTSRKPKN